MPNGSTANTDQHYVPQLLLRGFSREVEEQVFVFDKRTEAVFRSSIRNIACERGFYNIQGTAALDRAMLRAEEAAAPIIQKIRVTKRVAGLTIHEHAMLVGFTVLQYVRTRAYIDRWQDMAQQLGESLERMSGGRVADELRQQLGTAAEREGVLSSIPGSTRKFMPHLLNKNLILLEAPDVLPFWISDSPVALANTVNPGDRIRGTLGFAVPGIEIYLPISSKLTLGFLCPSIGEAYELERREVARMGFVSEAAQMYLQARNTGRPLLLSREKVRYQNSLQLIYGERFVFSATEDFADALAMVRDNPDRRVGPRIQMQ
jgi:hypothetical protein